MSGRRTSQLTDEVHLLESVGMFGKKMPWLANGKGSARGGTLREKSFYSDATWRVSE